MPHIRVLELSHAVAGPTVTQILADYGAEVIKIERPQGGDIFRNVPGMGPSMFLAVNRGKKSVALDMKTKKGLSLFYDLLKECDVLVENLSPGAAEKLGVTYMRAIRVNPRLVYCKIESFGAGPMESLPAFDPVLQAATGIMSTTGFPPKRFARAGVSIVDMSTGMHGAIATMFMLLEREKSGRGGMIKVPLYDAAAYYMSYWITRADLTGKDTVPLGSTHIFGAPYNLFKTREGEFIFIAIAGNEAWASLCNALGFNDLLSKAGYSTNEKRVRRKKKLEAEVGRRISKMGIAYLQRELTKRKVPFAKLNSAKSLILDPHFKARGLLEEYSFEGKRFRTIVNPAVIRGKRLHARNNPPELGEHTSEVLGKVMKLSREEIRRLVQHGIISDR
ncbi:MAG: CaiB/BaiF CoA transferase family protein [Nitrososphaerales archaeon]